MPESYPLCAVIVTFNPDMDFIERLMNAKEIFDEVVVVNNSLESILNITKRDSPLGKGVHLVENHENIGVAKALNKGLKYAFGLGYEQVVTFDQDTQVFFSFRDWCNSLFLHFGNKSILVGANYRDINKSRDRYKCKKQEGFLKECTTVITSGMVVSKQVVERIGWFREDYFIDSIDHEYCLRARKAGIKVYCGCRSVMSHSIGDRKVNKFVPVLAYSHSSIRKYYMTRNTLATIKCYWKEEPIWSIKQLLRIVVELISVIVSDKNKKLKIEAMFLGGRHAINNKMGGVIPEYLSRRLENDKAQD